MSRSSGRTWSYYRRLVIFWVVCAGAYEGRAKKAICTVAELLTLLLFRLRYWVTVSLAPATRISVRVGVNEMLFQALASQNVEMLHEAGATKICRYLSSPLQHTEI